MTSDLFKNKLPLFCKFCYCDKSFKASLNALEDFIKDNINGLPASLTERSVVDALIDPLKSKSTSDILYRCRVIIANLSTRFYKRNDSQRDAFNSHDLDMAAASLFCTVYGQYLFNQNKLK